MTGRREEILDVASAIADERGIGAVSMRAVAERIGVTPMALYSHVGGKTGLLDGMVGRLLAELKPASPELKWQERLRTFAYAARELVRRHPWAATLLFARPAISPDGVGAVDQIYLALLDAGVPNRETPRLERMVSTFVLGYAASEASGRFTSGDPRGRRGQELPGHTRLRPWLERQVDWDAEFEADLADLERLIETAAERGRYSR